MMIPQLRFDDQRKCPLCGKEDGTVLYTDSMDSPKMREHLDSRYINLPEKFNAIYLAIKCDCGMIYQGEILDNQSLDLFYENCIPEESVNKRKLAAKEHYYGYAREIAAISRLVKKPNYETKVLDFGCGWAYWCLMAKAFGFDVYGYDLSLKRREYAKNELGIKVVDKHTLDSMTDQFDFINLDQVLEHLPDPLHLLSDIASYGKSGSYLHIHVPDGRKLSNGFSNPKFRLAPWKSLMPLEHLNSFTHKTLIRMAEKVGYNYISQPTMRSMRFGVKSKVKGLLSNHYQQHRGTSLYFKKA